MTNINCHTCCTQEVISWQTLAGEQIPWLNQTKSQRPAHNTSPEFSHVRVCGRLPGMFANCRLDAHPTLSLIEDTIFLFSDEPSVGFHGSTAVHGGADKFSCFQVKLLC